jgi:hypothetical protein
MDHQSIGAVWRLYRLLNRQCPVAQKVRDDCAESSDRLRREFEAIAQKVVSFEDIATDAIAARVGVMDVSWSEAQRAETNVIARSDDRAVSE